MHGETRSVNFDGLKFRYRASPRTELADRDVTWRRVYSSARAAEAVAQAYASSSFNCAAVVHS